MRQKYKSFNKTFTSKSFTLIEILVVIAIIGLLSSITLVALKGVREKARIAADLNFSAQIYHALGADIAGEWNFDDGTAKDNSGNDLTTITHGGVTSVDGIVRGALDFNGSTGYIEIPDPGDSPSNNSILDITNTITVEFWFKPESVVSDFEVLLFKTWQYLIYIDESQKATFVLYLMKDGTFDKLGILDSGSETFKTAEWNYIAGTFGYFGGVKKMKLFLNGEEANSSEDFSGNTISVSDGDLPLTIGAADDGGPIDNFFKGSIDEVRLYDNGLSSSQIKKLYAEGAEKRGLFVKEY